MTRGGTDMATYTKPRTPGTRRAAPPDLRRGAPSSGADPARRPNRSPAGTMPRPDAAPQTRPFGAPRHTRPLTGPARPAKPARPARPAKPAKPATRPAARLAIARTRPRHPRAPFILLLVGLLGGALISLLVISTTLAEGSYRITSLQQQDTNLAKQEQLLTQQVAQASSPGQIAQEAEAFGMRPNPELQFIDLKTGKVVKGQVPKADAGINVPGYTP